MLDFGDAEDVSLYTNAIQKYPEDKQIFVGFPTWYHYRRAWTANYDELCGKERRRWRMENYSARSGLVVTDCVFITSRDGIHFKKYDEAFMKPYAEFPGNWLYGDCFPALGLIDTPSDIAGADRELSMFVPVGHNCLAHTILERFTIRRDSFVSMHAGAKEKMLVTKQFVFSGKDLFINFETSALGYMYFTLVDEDGKRYESCETFGDRTDRRVPFEEGAVEKLSGKPVTLEVRMRDADLYAIVFR